jgi:hypothetical protein
MENFRILDFDSIINIYFEKTFMTVFMGRYNGISYPNNNNTWVISGDFLRSKDKNMKFGWVDV